MQIRRLDGGMRPKVASISSCLHWRNPRPSGRGRCCNRLDVLQLAKEYDMFRISENTVDTICRADAAARVVGMWLACRGNGNVEYAVLQMLGRRGENKNVHK